MARIIAAADFDPAAFIRAGDRVMCGQIASEPLTLTRALAAAADRIGRLEVFLGMTLSRTFPRDASANLTFRSYGALGRAAELSRAGRLDILPLHYGALSAACASRAVGADVVLIQLGGTPDAPSLGLANDYVAQAARHARTVIAELNPGTPVTTGAALPPDVEVAAFVEAASPPLEVPSGAMDDASESIGRLIAGLVPDGATIQIGVGSIPDAVLSALSSHRDLGVHSGVATDRILDLIEAGVITNARKGARRGATVTNTLIGTRRLYDFAHGNPEIMVLPASETHDYRVLSGLERFFSINSANEVDLTGRANSEMAAGHRVGGLGGLPDFARGARASEGGASIIALPSTAAGGRVSRIVPRVETTTAGPGDVDFVVTEFGVADLRFATYGERAGRLAAIAHPDHREGLERAARG